MLAFPRRHRSFVFVDGDMLPDQKVRVVTSDDALVLGVLSSACHVEWARAAGGTLEDRPVYNNTTCFEPFPFPSDDTGLTPALSARLRSLGEQIDAHRKARQAEHPALTLTGIYNVLEKVRAGEALVPKERETHEQALVSVLRTLHDDLDSAVLEAYGWADLAPALADRTATEARETAVSTLLERLVALNAKRAAEESTGIVRWLRPEFQHPAAGTVTQATIDTGADEEEAAEEAPAKAAIAQQAWPKTLPEQIKAVADVLTCAGGPLTIDEIAARFKARGRWRERLPTIVEALQAIGRARAAAGESERFVAGIS